MGILYIVLKVISGIEEKRQLFINVEICWKFDKMNVIVEWKLICCVHTIKFCLYTHIYNLRIIAFNYEVRVSKLEAVMNS
jgi:hypothetical protein